MTMISNTFVLLFCLAATGIAVAEQESKFQEIIKLLNDNEHQLQHQNHQLNAEAQTFSASVADPSGYVTSSVSASAPQGFRAADRSRYISQPNSNSNSNLSEEDEKKLAEEEDEKKPDRLALLLAESKFSCESLKNGYYADESVGCQVFHYCIDGVKHSWQCPENTVFHQIHLNCVPSTQDICPHSSKYHIVNEYLHKELDERGPNNTVMYHQRFYPDGFDYSGGDPVAQIFQAQAQAALQKARQRQPQPIADDDDDEPAPAPRPRARAKPVSQPQFSFQSGPPPQGRQPQVITAAKPLYRTQVSRPLVSYSPQSPSSLPPSTRRPISFSTPDTSFSGPTYSESSSNRDDEFNSPGANEYSPADHSSSASGIERFQPTSHGFSVSSPSSSYSPASSASSSSSGPSPSSGFSSSQSSSGFQPTSAVVSSYSSSGAAAGRNSYGAQSSPVTGSTSSSSGRTSGGGYPTRSLGIPIASFRVAPASSFQPSGSTGPGETPDTASSIQDVNVAPLIGGQALNNEESPDENGQILSRLFY